MSHGLVEIHNRLRAADRALALCRGGTSELAQLREAAGSLLVAMHELMELWEQREPAPAPEAEAPRGRGGRR